MREQDINYVYRQSAKMTRRLSSIPRVVTPIVGAYAGWELGKSLGSGDAVASLAAFDLAMGAFIASEVGWYFLREKVSEIFRNYYSNRLELHL